MRSISQARSLLEGKLAGEALRFLIAGGINTLLTYLIYVAALAWVSYSVAYSLSFASGIAITLILNGKWVYRSSVTLRAAMWFIFIYGLQYGLGLLLLRIFVERAGIPKQFASLAVLACCVPITFILTRLVFVRAPKGA